ncbi:MAG: prephenate dehydrogenase/arogenate dehydrogenase family protein [Nitrososphaerota archaeon]|nr:prephenate dehydrogenase/arogenate dehydrogenase family protein [Nitrososphaerota archaeon]
MKIAVLGSSGMMGSYFTRRFLQDGHSVTGHDTRKRRGSPRGFTFADSNVRAVGGADAVLISVPIAETARVGREVAPHLKGGAALVEISSVKTKVRRDLTGALAGRNVTMISVHPMFGPHSTSAHPKMLVLGKAREVAISRSLFPWAQLISIGERDHDRLMAYALSLVHTLNLAFASSVSKRIGIKEFKKVSSPMGSAQLGLAEAVLSQDPSLYSSIQLENPFTTEAISSAIEELQGLLKLIGGKKWKAFERRFVSLSEEFSEASLREALDRVYSSFG